MSQSELLPPPDERLSWVCSVRATQHERRRKPFYAHPPSVREVVVWSFPPCPEGSGASWSLWWELKSRWGRPSGSWPAVCQGWRRGSCVPNAGTRGAEAREEEEGATGWGGPRLPGLHTPKTRQSAARTRQTWRRRGKCTHNVENTTCSGGRCIHSKVIKKLFK